TFVTERTRPGIILGTIAYMSPEQASGRRVDARTDIFSFGVGLYGMLAGRKPFACATELELLTAIILGTPAPLRDDVPDAAGAVVGKALEKDPAERYQSMREMVIDLRHVLRHSGVAEAPAISHRARAWKWQRLGAAVLAVALAGGSALMYMRRQRPA